MLFSAEAQAVAVGTDGFLRRSVAIVADESLLLFQKLFDFSVRFRFRFGRRWKLDACGTGLQFCALPDEFLLSGIGEAATGGIRRVLPS